VEVKFYLTSFKKGFYFFIKKNKKGKIKKNPYLKSDIMENATVPIKHIRLIINIFLFI